MHFLIPGRFNNKSCNYIAVLIIANEHTWFVPCILFGASFFLSRSALSPKQFSRLIFDLTFSSFSMQTTISPNSESYERNQQWHQSLVLSYINEYVVANGLLVVKHHPYGTKKLRRTSCLYILIFFHTKKHHKLLYRSML